MTYFETMLVLEKLVLVLIVSLDIRLVLPEAENCTSTINE